jgi:hypothetical protein
LAVGKDSGVAPSSLRFDATSQFWSLGSIERMKFEKPSADECRELVQRLRGKTIEEIVVMFGSPARETGSRKEERVGDDVPFVVEIRRTLTFYGVGKTIHRLKVVERIDGQFEFQMQGREIVDDPAA